MKFLKKHIALLILILCVGGRVLSYCTEKKVQQPLATDLPEVRNSILQTNRQFASQLEKLITLTGQDTSPDILRKEFDGLRIIYKQMEWAVEYFQPTSARFMNGPALPEIEFEEHTVLEPEGLQVLEELLYDYDPQNNPEIIRYLKKLQSKSGAVKSTFSTITVNRAQVFDALRMHLFRISSLYISGFDTPISGNHLKEMPYSLNSISEILPLIADQKNTELRKITESLRNAVTILKNNPNKNSFDHLAFISENLNKISAQMQDFKHTAGIENINITSALKRDARTMYDQSAFDVDAFVPGEQFKLTAEKIALGKKLFNDPFLSKGENRSCASCHIPEKAFTDGQAKPFSLENNPLHRNTPSLNYAAFQHGQFWDMRNADLEGQSSEVITNKDEMHGNLDDIIARINANETYRSQFEKIYKTKTAEIWQLQNLLASYIRSMPKFSSRFDEFMRGNPSALSEDEKSGFNLAVGKAKCATCHFLPLFNGTVPPVYSKTEQEVLGTAEDGTNRKLDSDPGRGRFHETVPLLQRSFKTPTLRNVGKTAPYMHNGGYSTLQHVMDFYNKGGGAGLRFKIDNQTLPPDELHLTEKEINQIIAFLKSLDDR